MAQAINIDLFLKRHLAHFSRWMLSIAMDAAVRHSQNSKSVGDITQSQIMAALLRRGNKVLMPFGDNCRYDLVVEQEDDLPLVQEAKLRLTPPRNSQVKGIRWAAEYEI